MNADTEFDKTDWRNVMPRFTKENRKANQTIVDLVTKIAGEHNATPAQVHWHGCWRKAMDCADSRTRKITRLDRQYSQCETSL